MNLALNPFNKGRKPETVEKVDLEGKLNDLMELFKRAQNYLKYSGYNNNYCAVKYERKLRELDKKLWTPNDIENFSLAVMPESYLEEGWLGMYYHKMIKDSYNTGNNDFTLHSNSGIVSLNRLRGAEDRRLKVTIEADVGDEFGDCSTYCDFVIKGEAGNGLGYHAKYCSFDCHGDVADDCAFGSRNCVYTFRGCVAHVSYEARDCVFKADGRTHEHLLTYVVEEMGRVEEI